MPKTLFHRADTLISEEEDKEKEREYVKKALRKCGYPEWAFEKKKKEKPKKKDDEDGEKLRVCIPYVKHLSERIAREFRKHDFEVMYIPTTKIKNILCNNMKDPIPDLDKAGVNYYFNCRPHQDDYDGETGRPNKERQYEHGLITRKQALSSEAILENKEEKQHQATRHSQRLALKEPINYKELSTGSNIKLTTGNTAISEHMALLEHKPGDVSVKIMRREKDKFKRGVREAINIKKHKPTLNKDLQDRFYLQPIYDNIIKPENLKTIPPTP